MKCSFVNCWNYRLYYLQRLLASVIHDTILGGYSTKNGALIFT